MSYKGLGTGFDISHAGAPYKGMLGLGANDGVPMKTVKVLDLQKTLLSKGFSVGPTGADGIWGPNTESGYVKACGSKDIWVAPSFCDLYEPAPGNRYVKVPKVVHSALVDMPTNPIPDPARRAPKKSPFDLDFGKDGDGKTWPWVVGIGSGVLLLGGLYLWYQQEQESPRPVTPNRRRRRRRRT